jgi:protein-S-isoprenylcysteine O-methyltransferase Ste14
LLVLRTVLFTVVVPATVVLYVPAGLAGSRAGVDPGLRLVGLAVAAGGLLLTGWCWVEFISRGRGTPAPWDPPRLLVRGGPYRYVRNPIYIGIVAVLLGETAFLRSAALLLWSLVVALSFHLAVVLYEEPGLKERFGVDYERYMAAVPRWVPRLRRSRPIE